MDNEGNLDSLLGPLPVPEGAFNLYTEKQMKAERERCFEEGRQIEIHNAKQETS